MNYYIFFGLIYSIEVQKLQESRMYRRSADSDILKAMHYVCVMPKSRSEVTLTNLYSLNQKTEISKSDFFQTC